MSRTLSKCASVIFISRSRFGVPGVPRSCGDLARCQHLGHALLLYADHAGTGLWGELDNIPNSWFQLQSPSSRWYISGWYLSSSTYTFNWLLSLVISHKSSAILAPLKSSYMQPLTVDTNYCHHPHLILSVGLDLLHECSSLTANPLHSPSVLNPLPCNLSTCSLACIWVPSCGTNSQCICWNFALNCNIFRAFGSSYNELWGGCTISEHFSVIAWQTNGTAFHLIAVFVFADGWSGMRHYWSDGRI